MAPVVNNGDVGAKRSIRKGRLKNANSISNGYGGANGSHTT